MSSGDVAGAGQHLCSMFLIIRLGAGELGWVPDPWQLNQLVPTSAQRFRGNEGGEREEREKKEKKGTQMTKGGGTLSGKLARASLATVRWTVHCNLSVAAVRVGLIDARVGGDGGAGLVLHESDQ